MDRSLLVWHPQNIKPSCRTLRLGQLYCRPEYLQRRKLQFYMSIHQIGFFSTPCFFLSPLVPSRLTVGPINFLPRINLPPPVSPPRLLLLNFPSIAAAYVGVRACVFRVFAQCKHSCTRAQVGGEARRCGCLRGRVCASHAKLSPFSLSLYPFAFFFSPYVR